jgi:hypothetical protein
VVALFVFFLEGVDGGVVGGGGQRRLVVVEREMPSRLKFGVIQYSLVSRLVLDEGLVAL